MTSPSDRQNGPASNATHLSNGSVLDDASFRAVANYTCDWESWHASDGRLLWVNDAVERMTGYTAKECLAMRDYPLPMTAPEYRERIARMLEGAKSGTSRNDVEFESVHRHGERRWMAVSWQPMYADDGKHLGFRTSIRDITERHKLRDEIRLHAEHLEQLVQERTAHISKLEQHRRQMEKLAALGQLAAGVAHEVNNPLAGIRNAFELMKSDFASDHPHFELLELVDREIERISSITHQMYQLYRRSPHRPIEFTLETAIAEVITLLEAVAKKQNVFIALNSTAESTRVMLPEGEVKQVLYNVLRNAIQASPIGKSVTVAVSKNGEDELCIAVSDCGHGISDDVLPHIFDPFYSTKAADTGAGMGLGLSVSRSLIEAMGGRMDVTSGVDEGSCFAVFLPMRLHEEHHNATNDAAEEHGDE